MFVMKMTTGDDIQEKIWETTRAKIEFHERYWSKVSDEAKTFIKSLLNLDPSQRPAAQLALNSHIMVDNAQSVYRARCHLWSQMTSIARKKWHSAIILARDDDDAEDTGDGETNVRSNQIKASLSLRGINSGSNEDVKVIGPDGKGDQLGKRDVSSSPCVSLTGTGESSVKGKTAFSSLATSRERERSLPDEPLG
ncbi:hypothetical protein AZE42_11540 [Rhizopogon vesiculosus]|uniref:Protein kinase domain-containing protein n=1 Tax=Rhizopogon vesiculosus TaxID=180088 RepID=A0A1J8QD27_9AGAM|nr:hypothetical protein AZE42_11540 [Rhizopogon vesiculosus]